MVFEKQKDKEVKVFSAVGFAWELGYTIAVPLVLAAFLGRWADGFFGTKPFLFLASILVAIVGTAYAVIRKTTAMMRSFEEK